MIVEQKSCPACGYVPPPRCQITGCNEEAVYEAWFRVRDPAFGKPTGLIQKFLVCENHVKLSIHHEKEGATGRE